MPVGSQTVIKWVAAGAIAAVIATVGFFSNVGTPLVQGLVMVAIGVGILMFIGTKQLGVATAIPAGFIIAGGIVLTNEYIVPLINKGTTA